MKISFGPRSLLVLLTVGCLLAARSEAKTHHSKRQAPSYSPTSTGRENTNWWNLWWQQYISEAVQPTVRPIIGVSFNGQSIALDNENDNVNTGQDSDLDSNLLSNVQPNAAPSASSTNNNSEPDLERQSYIVGADQQNRLSSQSRSLNLRSASAQQQANWQSVRPTIIQMRPARRQVLEQVDREEVQQEPMQGIQMRVNQAQARANSRQQQEQQVQMAQTKANDEARFEQQLNQMVDYSEEGEPDLDLNVPPANNRQPERSRPDSSSSSMMEPTGGTGQQRQQPPPVMTIGPSRPQTFVPASSTSTPTGTTSNTSGPTTRTSSPSSSGSTSSTSNPATSSAAPSGGSTSTPSSIATSVTSSTTSGSSSTTSTTTSTSTTTTTSSPVVFVTEVDINETPISLEPESSQQTTPANGRVELMNGRPAAGMRQQTSSTNSARLPSTSSPIPSSTSSVSSSTSRPQIDLSTNSIDLARTTSSGQSTTESSSAAPSSSSAPDSEVPTTTTSSNSEAEMDDDNDDTPSDERPNLNAPGEPTETNMDKDEENDSDEANEEDETEPVEPSTASNTVGGAQTSTPEPTSSSTQLPAAVANIEINRLPKTNLSVSAADTQTGGANQAPEKGSESAKPSANLVMTNLADEQPASNINSPDDPNASIALPMDTLVRLMMMNRLLEDERRKATTPSSSGSNSFNVQSSQEQPGFPNSSPTGIDSEEQSRVGSSNASAPTTKSPPVGSQPPPVTPSTRPAMTVKVETPLSNGGAKQDRRVTGEPKVELLNLDLMPIQRIMTAQDREQKQMQPPSVAPPKSTVSPSTTANVEMRQASTFVEPGMRLWPVTSSTASPLPNTSAKLQTPPMIGVKMIGKPPNAPTGSTVKRPLDQSTSGTTATSSQPMKTPTASSTLPPPVRPMSTSRRPEVSSASSGPIMNLVETSSRSPISSTQKPTGQTSGGNNSAQFSSTTSSQPASSTTASSVPPSSTTPTISSSSLPSSTSSPATKASTELPVPSSSVDPLSSTLSSGSSTKSNETTSKHTSPAPSQSTTTQSPRAKLERIQLANMTNATTPQANPGTKTNLSATKQGAGKQSNSTSSFIPNKLRNDFSGFASTSPASSEPANLSSQTPSPTSHSAKPAPTESATQSPAQAGMAIRQFGGANRMSVLANQPVPFGRPTAMQTSKQRFEVPTFEYGPAIAVRRPDEPLANGQVPNCTLTGKNFCVLTKDYPMNEVRQAVERSFRSVRIMYEELQTVSDQELHREDFKNATSQQAASGKFACQTQVEMMRPGWAKDEITRGWMLVVNTDVFPQRVRTESCALPNTPCEFIAPFYDSTCQQRYSLHRMIAIDPHDPTRSPQVAIFKFPAGCVCRVHPIKKTTTVSMLMQTTMAAQQTTPNPPTQSSSTQATSSMRQRRR